MSDHSNPSPSTSPPPLAPMRVLFLAMLGDLSLIPLQALLQGGIEVCGVVVPAGLSGSEAAGRPIVPLRPPPVVSQLPLANRFLSPTAVQLAWERTIPVFELHRPEAAETRMELAALAPDVGVISCFSKRIPPSLLNLPPYGFLNLHPSLLPAYRGPAPLFWMLQQGESESGVTVHVVDEGLDTGDIVRQRPIYLPGGGSDRDIERLHAAAGGELIVEVVQQLRRGGLVRRPQPAGGSYFSHPRPADFQLDLSWPASRAFNFMRGTASWGRPYPLLIDGKGIRLRSAVDVSHDGTQVEPLILNGRDALIRFATGILQARLA